MIVDREPISIADAFELEAVKQHLRILHDDEDATILAMARAAARKIEDTANIALLAQDIVIFWPAFPNVAEFALPIGPLFAPPVVAVEVAGAVYSDFEIIGIKHPVLRLTQGVRDVLFENVSVTYRAGFGADAASIPADLAHALADQVGAMFDNRSPHDSREISMSAHLLRTVARYRRVSM